MAVTFTSIPARRVKAPKSSYSGFCDETYAVRYPTARASSHRTGAEWASVNVAVGTRPVHRTIVALNVLGVCEVSTPRAARSRATSSRKGLLQAGGGSEQLASARTLSVRTKSTSRGLARCRASAARGAGVRSETPCRRRHWPVTAMRSAWTAPWTKQVSGVAA